MIKSVNHVRNFCCVPVNALVWLRHNNLTPKNMTVKQGISTLINMGIFKPMKFHCLNRLRSRATLLPVLCLSVPLYQEWRKWLCPEPILGPNFTQMGFIQWRGSRPGLILHPTLFCNVTNCSKCNSTNGFLTRIHDLCVPLFAILCCVA